MIFFSGHRHRNALRKIGYVLLPILSLCLFSINVSAQEKRYEAPKAIPITPILPMESTNGEARKALPSHLHKDARVNYSLSSSAVLNGSAAPIDAGLIWRLYAVADSEEPTLVSELIEASPVQLLPQGEYIVHVSYGYASAMKKIVLNADAFIQLQIDAGGLRIAGVVEKKAIEPKDLTYSVFMAEDNNPEGRLVAGAIESDTILRLPPGDYHVVSHYGTSNAISSADLAVEPGKVTEATVTHRGAKIALKLVASKGAEAFAGAAFSILTPGGDTIHEEVGTFPSVILSEGNYVVIARHEGQVYTQEFVVETGIDKEIEIVGQL